MSVLYCRLVDLLAIAKCLGQCDTELRRAAARALGQIGVPARSAIPALRDAFDDRDSKVSSEARDAIERIREQADAVQGPNSNGASSQSAIDFNSLQTMATINTRYGYSAPVSDPNDEWITRKLIAELRTEQFDEPDNDHTQVSVGNEHWAVTAQVSGLITFDNMDLLEGEESDLPETMYLTQASIIGKRRRRQKPHC